MNAFETAQALQITGTDSEVVSTLQTLSSSDITADSVREWLRRNSLLAWDGSAWFGTLQDMILAGTLAPDLVIGIRNLKALMLGGQKLATTDPTTAVTVWAVVSGIAALVGGDQSATIDSFYALDGGRPFKALTVTEYQSQRSDSQRLSAADQYAAGKMNEVLNPAFSDPSRTVATIQAAFTAAATVTI
jgi:hypothetical protein